MFKHLFVDETSSLRVPAEIRISSWLLALYVALLPIATGLTGLIGSISPLNYVAALYLLVSFFERLRGREAIIKKEFSFAYFYFCFTTLSFLWNANRSFDWYFTTFLTTALLFTMAASRRYSKKELKLFIAASMVSIGIVFAVTAMNFPPRFYRFVFKAITKMDSNDFACGLCVVIALIMTMSLQEKRSWMVLILSLLYLIVVFSSSRGAMLLTVGMTIWWIGAAAARKKILIPLIPVILFAVMFLIVVFAGTSLLHMKAKTVKFMISRLNPMLLLQSGGQGRAVIWKAAFQTFLDSNPLRMLFGYGHGAFRNAVNYPGPEVEKAFLSHNMYVNALIEGGAVGLALLLAAFVQLFRFTLKNKNLWGTLALIGFALEGVSLDAQTFRVFAWAFIVAAIYGGGEKNELVFAASGDGDRTDLQG